MILKTKIKLGITVLLVIILLIFIALNTQVITVNFIIAKVEIKRSIMVLTAFLIGIFAGWSLNSATKSKKQ